MRTGICRMKNISRGNSENERSADGKEFSEIRTVQSESSGAESYTYIDAAPLPGAALRESAASEIASVTEAAVRSPKRPAPSTVLPAASSARSAVSRLASRICWILSAVFSISSLASECAERSHASAIRVPASIVRQAMRSAASSSENAVDLLTMARSFGSYFVLLTQSLTSATRDQDILNSITGNVRWIVLLRSTLRDCGLIAPAIPLTGTRTKPKRNLFESTQYMSEGEELKSRLADVTRFPDRVAFCWLKPHVDRAVKIMTQHVPKPHEVAGCGQEEFDEFQRTETFGQGVPRREIERVLEGHRRRLHELLRSRAQSVFTTPRAQQGEGESRRSLTKVLEEEYERKRRQE